MLKAGQILYDNDVRYRYYVSHTLLQRRKKDAGRVTRVPAIQLEKLVVEAIRPCRIRNRRAVFPIAR
jgi:hypothetical protein